jgi:cell wall assembly regulator SMI1
MPPLLSRLDAWLRKHRPRFLKSLQRGATQADLYTLSKTLHGPVPSGLRDILVWHNGQGSGEDYVGYFVDHWLLMSTTAIAAAKTDLDATGLEHGWKKEWVPILDDDGGNFVVLDSSKPQPAMLIFWMDAQAEILAPSVEAWLGEFVGAVEAGLYYEDPERGTFKRTGDNK